MAVNFLGNRRNRYIFLLPVVFLLVNAVYFQYASKRIEGTVLQEKYVEMTHQVDMLAAAVEGNNTWHWEEHEQYIQRSVEYMDRLNMAYASAYKTVSGTLTLISDRHIVLGFNPFLYDEFKEAIATQESGSLKLDFLPKNGPFRVMYVYFRYMPVYTLPSEKYLVIAAISKYGIVTPIPVLVSAGQWVSMAMTFTLNVWLILLIVRIGDLCKLSECDVCQKKKGGDGVV